MSEHRHLIHHHLCQVTTVSALMGDKSRCRNHVRSHSIADEQNDILCALYFGQRSDQPAGNGLGPVVVGQCGLIIAGLVEDDTAVRLPGDLDQGRGLCVLGEQVFEPGEVPRLELWLSDLEVGCSVDGSASFLGDREGEARVRDTAIRLRAIDRSMNFESDVKVLTGEKVRPDWGGESTPSARSSVSIFLPV